MPTEAYIENISEWIRIVHDPDNEFIPEITADPEKYIKIFIEKISESLYNDLKRTERTKQTPFSFSKEFLNLSEEEKKTWYDHAAAIPRKLSLLNLFLKPYKTYFRTCIITDSEIERLALNDLSNYLKRDKAEQGNTSAELKSFFMELNYLLPPQLVKAGFEIIRKEEESLNDNILIRKLARAIHSRYLQDIRNRNVAGKKTTSGYPGDEGNLHVVSFEDLPEDIVYSNLDNAYHIPTKLLAIGYRIRPVEEGHKPVTLHLNEEQTEAMARVEHLRWSWDKRLNGWVFGNTRDTGKKIHPGLIPYDDLPEQEKEKDRALVRLIPSLLQDIGYVAFPVAHGDHNKLSYAIKPHSSIHKLLSEIHKLNSEMEEIVSVHPGITERLNKSNKKIEEIINEVQGSYNYAQHIQATFLPDDLYVRECFPDSFILYKPKDVVSGDFYFFSKKGSTVVLAAADCTGHGIPGALISTIGYGITDQAVNQANLTCPAEIIYYLFSKVHKFLRYEEDGTGMSDDMDIAVCAIDLDARVLEYSGVGSPVYHVRDGVLTEYKAHNIIGKLKEKEEIPIVSDMFEIKTGDTIYLFSDGYADQFGGNSHKKYQRSRFKSFLLEIQKHPMAEQCDMLYQEIEEWREENDEDQTDDIMVIGVRI